MCPVFPIGLWVSEGKDYTLTCLCAQLCPTQRPHRCLSGSPVHGIFPARILEWVAISSSRGSSQPRDWNCISCIFCIGKQFLTTGSLGSLYITPINCSQIYVDKWLGYRASSKNKTSSSVIWKYLSLMLTFTYDFVFPSQVACTYFRVSGWASQCLAHRVSSKKVGNVSEQSSPRDKRWNWKFNPLKPHEDPSPGVWDSRHD